MKIASSTNGVGRAGQLHEKKNETGAPTYQLIPYTNINSRWIKDLHISHDTIKVLGVNRGRNISGIPCIKIFTNMSPRIRDIKEKNKQMGSHQNKKLLHG